MVPDQHLARSQRYVRLELQLFRLESAECLFRLALVATSHLLLPSVDLPSPTVAYQVRYRHSRTEVPRINIASYCLAAPSKGAAFICALSSTLQGASCLAQS